MAHERSGHRLQPKTLGAQRFNAWFNRKFNACSTVTKACLNCRLLRPLATVLGITGIFILSLGAYPLDRQGLFSAHRSRPVRHQSQGAHRHAARN